MIYGNVFADGHSNNSQFAEDNDVHRFNPTYTPRLLRKSFLKQGIEINTPDVNQGKKVAFDLHFEGRQFIENDTKRYLIAMENPNINRLNENRDYYRKFSKVFTWDVRQFELPNVVQTMVPNQLSYECFPGYGERKIFSCLINANKAFREKVHSDLYRERINTIHWYEQHAPEKFELFGMGWDKPTPAFDLLGKIKRIMPSLKKIIIGIKPFPSYHGEVKDKRSVLLNSKFSYCYENTSGPDNYITEKIFDSFLSGCIPVYWGADNVFEYIPSDCFIDRRRFNNTARVHQFLLKVSPEKYANYQLNIARFLKSDRAKIFSSEHFVSIVVRTVVQDLRTTPETFLVQ